MSSWQMAWSSWSEAFSLLWRKKTFVLLLLPASLASALSSHFFPSPKDISLSDLFAGRVPLPPVPIQLGCELLDALCFVFALAAAVYLVRERASRPVSLVEAAQFAWSRRSLLAGLAIIPTVLGAPLVVTESVRPGAGVFVGGVVLTFVLQWLMRFSVAGASQREAIPLQEAIKRGAESIGNNWVLVLLYELAGALYAMALGLAVTVILGVPLAMGIGALASRSFLEVFRTNALTSVVVVPVIQAVSALSFAVLLEQLARTKQDPTRPQGKLGELLARVESERS